MDIERGPEMQEKEKKSKKKDKEKEKKENSVRFKPPTLEDVSEYCRKNEYNVDAQRFIDFYESKGWMIGKNKMRDWKAAVRNWSRSQRQELTTKAENNRFNNFQQRDNSEVFAALERGTP